MISFNTQPKVLQKFIFSFLPEEDRRICRLVCKQWKENINELLNPIFLSKIIILKKFPLFGHMKEKNGRMKVIENLLGLTHSLPKDFQCLIDKTYQTYGSYFEITTSFEPIVNTLNSIDFFVSKMNSSDFFVSKITSYKSVLEANVQKTKKGLLNARDDILNQVQHEIDRIPKEEPNWEIDRIPKEEPNWEKKVLREDHWLEILKLMKKYFVGDSDRTSILGEAVSELASAVKSIHGQMENEHCSIKVKCLSIYTMDLNGLDIKVLPGNFLEFASNLILLEINQNKMEEFYLNFEKLQHLTIANNLLNNVNLRGLKGLTELNLSVNKIKNIDLSANWELIHLNLSGNPIQISSLDLSRNIKLETLNLSNNLNDDKSQTFLNLINNKKMKELILEKCSNVEVTISKIVKPRFQFKADDLNKISCIYPDDEDEEEVVTDEEDPFAPLNDNESVDSAEDKGVDSAEDDS